MQDPLIKQRVIQLAGELATGPLKRNPRFVLKAFEFTMKTRCPEEPASETYNDAVKDLQGYCGHQLQRLAMRFPDYLTVSEGSPNASGDDANVNQNVYDELERKLTEMFTTTTLDEASRIRYSSVLFIIT